MLVCKLCPCRWFWSPPGSLLGPWFFNFFISDLLLTVGAKCLIFADEMKVFGGFCCEVAGDLRRSFHGMAKWCSMNSMTLNANKFKFLSFSCSKDFLPIIYRNGRTSVAWCDVLKDFRVFFSLSLSLKPFGLLVSFISASGLQRIPEYQEYTEVFEAYIEVLVLRQESMFF